jgi:pilus assembly protein CpaB
MNSKRLIVLGIALVAATGAALLVRGMVGGGTPKVEAKLPPPIPVSEVLVANANLQPGQPLTPELVHWQKWPANSVDASFITHNESPSIDAAVKGTVVRMPLIAGQPITNTGIVHADTAGMMSAMLNPGMRAVSITISTDSGAGGFILPNDRIDLILSQKTNTNPPQVHAHTILSNVRVLAVDQIYKQDKDTKTVIAKSATLELTPRQAELVEKAQNQGMLSLSLRPLNDAQAGVASNTVPMPVASPTFDQDGEPGNTGNSGSGVNVIRYGVSHSNEAKPAEVPKGQ